MKMWPHPLDQAHNKGLTTGDRVTLVICSATILYGVVGLAVMVWDWTQSALG